MAAAPGVWRGLAAGVLEATLQALCQGTGQRPADVQAWLGTYPGSYESPVPHADGIPAWVGWQHFFNIFLMVLIIRSGWQVRTVAVDAAGRVELRERPTSCPGVTRSFVPIRPTWITRSRVLRSWRR